VRGPARGGGAATPATGGRLMVGGAGARRCEAAAAATRVRGALKISGQEHTPHREIPVPSTGCRAQRRPHLLLLALASAPAAPCTVAVVLGLAVAPPRTIVAECEPGWSCSAPLFGGWVGVALLLLRRAARSSISQLSMQ
jgi:hypothetical protein